MSKIHPLAEKIRYKTNRTTWTESASLSLDTTIRKWLEEKVILLNDCVISASIKEILELNQEPEWCEHVKLNKNTSGCGLGGPHDKWLFHLKNRTYPIEMIDECMFCPICGAKRP